MYVSIIHLGVPVGLFQVALPKHYARVFSLLRLTPPPPHSPSFDDARNKSVRKV